MEYLTKFLTAASMVLLTLGVTQTPQVAAPTTIPTTTSTSVVAPSTTVEPAPTTTADSNTAQGQCGEWWGLAQQTGWGPEEMETLDYVMWRESRCDPTQHNTTRNKDGSTDIGLTQINDRSWCLPTRWYPDGYLQSIGILTKVGCEELFDPETSLKAAKAIHDYSKETNGNGFKPWGV